MPNNPLPNFLNPQFPLEPLSASMAILIVEDGGYVMQLRDDFPHIWYPDHWGLFGGGIDQGETPEQALVREIDEELGLAVQSFSLFTTFSFDFTHMGRSVLQRYFFEVHTTRQAIALTRINEGREMRIVQPVDLLANYKIAPYDSFGLWMHHSQKRLQKSLVEKSLANAQCTFSRRTQKHPI